MKLITVLMIAGVAGTAGAQSPPQYKIHLDPTMTLAGYANIQLDRQMTSSLTAGLMLWHIDEQLWMGSQETSFGIRLDWYEKDPFMRGWHSNGMVKIDFEGSDYARSRLKLTQTYQWVFGELYANLGIGVQFVSEADRQAQSYYQDYQSWMLPAYEISLGRAF